MTHFCDTLETAPAAMATAAYGKEHICWLIVFAAVTAGIVYFYRTLDDRRRDHLRLWLAGLAVAAELFKHLCLIIGGTWHPAYLPFSFCSLGIFFLAVHALKGSRLFADVLYVFYLPLSFIALLDPYWLALPTKNALFWFYFISHILLFAYPLMLTVGGDLRPDPRQWAKLLLLAVCLWIPLFAMDAALDVNFLFLMSAPEGNILNWFRDLCGAHLVGFPVLTILLLAAMYGLARLLDITCKKEV